VSSDPRSPLVDTHCHLNLADFDHDRLQVIERARVNCVDRILIPGIDVATSQSAIKFAHQFPEVFAAVGVHPNEAMSWSEESLIILRLLATEEKVVAIGEIGLDYYRNFAPQALQRTIFLLQLELAAEIGLPVIIHNRQASEDITRSLLDWTKGLSSNRSRLAHHPGVLHSFSGSVDMAKTMVGHNFNIGITGPVTFRNAQVLQAVVISTPLDSMLVETDAPYLTPHPYRGKRNEPANVRIVAEKIAELKDQPFEMVASITSGSADRLFDWREFH
jgi:TatD DNase family protein